MPVRIYDIAKKLGMESKEVLVRAKLLGISAAKVPSSSLDKITAEYLEEQLGGAKVSGGTPPPPPAEHHPAFITSENSPLPAEPAHDEHDEHHHAPAASDTPSAPVSTPTAEHAVRAVQSEPPSHTEPASAPAEMPVAQEPTVVEATPGSAAVEAAPAPATVEPAPIPVQGSEATTATESESAPVGEAPATTPPAEVVPPVPAAPRIGDKVGFIKLPTKPAPRTPTRPEARPDTRFGNRPPAPGAQDASRRPDNRDNRGRPLPPRPGQPGGQGQFQRPGQGGGGGYQSRQEQSRPAVPAEPKFIQPTTGELITLKPPIIVRDLAEQLKKKPFQLIADLMHLNVFANVNQAIDELVAQKLCAKYGFRFEVEKRERGGGVIHAPPKKVEVDIIDDKPEDLRPRAPVVTIMGHVDHGKTSLLDVIRKADVASGEAGGITQHIGAYTISIPHPERPKDLQQITFLDTPGHAAFSSMRARGANVTDLVVLVVAANDGVMPQTLEALSHAQAAKVPILVAVNKCDHPSANPMRVRQQLQEKGLVPDDWGGETIFVDVSALTKKGVDKLLEMIVLQSELLELKANPNRKAKGNVIESGLEPGGPTATVLVRKGTLRVGETLICGEYYGKVRALINEEGARLKEAGPSVAVKILGLNGVPEAGVEFAVIESEKAARAIAEERAELSKSQDNERRPKITLENLFDTLASENSKVLRVVVKADTQGSVEAIVEALQKIESSKVALEVTHSDVGTITKEDVLLASASKGIILGFHTRIDNGVSDTAKREGVQIKLYAIIYELIDQVKEAMAGLLDPLVKEVVIGSAEVRKVFALSKGGNVAGCIINSGRIVKGKMRVMRRKGLVYEGVSLSLRRFQDEVNEVRAGMECGIRLDGFNDFQVGDNIECYTLEKFAQKL